MSELTLYQNDNYTVDTFDASDSPWTEEEANDDAIYENGRRYDEYYIVINRGTGIVEHKTPQLVDAIVYAYNTDHMLRNKPWTWVEAAKEKQASLPLEAVELN